MESVICNNQDLFLHKDLLLSDVELNLVAQ